MIANEERVVDGIDGRLQEVLIAHLRAAGAPPWPGADGVTLEEVLLSYPQAAADGLVPGPDELLAEHPELADELRAFFAD